MDVCVWMCMYVFFTVLPQAALSAGLHYDSCTHARAHTNTHASLHMHTHTCKHTPTHTTHHTTHHTTPHHTTTQHNTHTHTHTHNKNNNTATVTNVLLSGVASLLCLWPLYHYSQLVHVPSLCGVCVPLFRACSRAES